jgi:hypothetical protein
VTTVGPEDHAGDDEPGLDRQTRVRAHQAVGEQLDRDACRDVEADQRKERQDRRAERLQRDHAGAGGNRRDQPEEDDSAREPRRDPLAKRPQREADDEDDSDQREVRLRPSFEAATSHPNTRAHQPSSAPLRRRAPQAAMIITKAHSRTRRLSSVGGDRRESLLGLNADGGGGRGLGVVYVSSIDDGSCGTSSGSRAPSTTGG